MRILCVANQKGGAGKTTITVGLAAAVAQAGGRVLVVDLDPQGNLTHALGRPALYAGDNDTNLATLLAAERATGDSLDELVDIGVWRPADDRPGRLDLIPSNEAMFLLESRLAGQRGREHRLARLFAQWSPYAEPYDVVLIDCPPSLGVLTDNALIAARSVVIAAAAEPSAIHGVGLLLDQIGGLAAALDVTVAVDGIIANRIEDTRVSRATLTRLAELGIPVVGTIPKRTLLQQAWHACLPVQAIDPAGELAHTFHGLAWALDLSPVAGRMVSR